MEASFVSRLSAQSTIAELPTYDRSLELGVHGEVLGKTFESEPWLPGVVVTNDRAVRGVISRGQYLRLVGRYLGLEVYHPRPLRLMLDALQSGEEPLVLPAETPIQQAVQRALERPREMIYEPLVLQDSAGRSAGDGPSLRLIDFPDLLRADARISTLRNRQMREILSTVREGFLLIDPDHKVASEYSQHLETILQSDWIAGRRFPGLLTEYLGEDKAALGRDYLDTLFNPNVIEKLVVQINPLREVTARMPDGSDKHLAFRFYRSVEGGKIQRVLARVEDTTLQVRMAEEMEAQERRSRDRMALTMEILSADALELVPFLDRLEGTLRETGRWLRETPTDASHSGNVPGTSLAALFRDLHGLKGEAGQLSLRLFRIQLHRCEEHIAALPSADPVASHLLGELRRGLESLGALLSEARSVLEQFRQLGGAARRTAPAQRPRQNEEISSESHSSAESPANAAQSAVPRQETVGLLAGTRRLVHQLAQKLGKEARFLCRQSEDQIPDRYRELLREVLPQLARNALVHGIEPPAERLRLGKPKMGTLQLAIRHHPQRRQLELIFQDDGQGLDLQRIREQATLRGLALDDESSVRMAVFASGVSTANETSLEAGRGVGLDLVRDRVEALGGVVRPHSKRGNYCAIQMVFRTTEPGTGES